MQDTVKTKKVIRRNLPINEAYKIVSSYYTGGIASGDLECCENCNKPIANVAVIENSQNKTFHVGMDCAGTLSGIKDSLEFMVSQNAFNEAKAIRTKVHKKLKEEGARLEVKNNERGEITIRVEDRRGCWSVWESVKKEFFFKYLPDFKENISNKEKNDFKQVAFVHELDEYDFGNLCYLKGFDPVDFHLHGFDFRLSTTEKQASNGKKNKMFLLTASKNDVSLKNITSFVSRDIKHDAVHQINKYFFENFKTKNQ